MAGMKSGGRVDVQGIMDYFGADLGKALGQVTDLTTKEIKTLTAQGGDALNKIFDKETVQGLFRYVLNQQNEESTPLGSEFNASYTQIVPDNIKTLAEEIGKAVANAVK
jgi:hypothetical protein